MYKYLFKYILLSILANLLSFSNLSSQQDFTLYNMTAVPQASYTNPAFIPASKLNIGLPAMSSIYFNVSNSGFKYNDVIQKREDDSLIRNIDNLISKLADVNILSSNIQVDLLSFGYRFKKNYFTFNATEKVNSYITLPKDLFVLAWEGNGKSFLGKRVDLDELAFDITHYREYALGYAREWNDKLTVGAKLKYLYGMEDIWTKEGQLGLTTDDPTFQLSLDGSKEIYTSGFDKKELSVDDDIRFVSSLMPYILILPDSAFDSFDFSTYAFKKKNRGLALDVGGVYKYSSKLSFSASVIDFGYIKWKTGVNNYISNEGVYSFKGKDLYDLFVNADSISIDSIFTNDIDTINGIFQHTETTDEYTHMLKMQVYIGATYNLNDNSKVGMMVHTAFVRGKMRESLILSYQYKLKRWLNASVNYSMYNRGYSNVGVGLSLNAGFFQYYIITDNILAGIYPNAFRNAHLRTGINLTFGRKKKEPKKPEVQLE